MHNYSRFSQIIHPIDAPVTRRKDRLQIETPGSKPNAFGKLSQISGRDYMQTRDVDGGGPRTIKYQKGYKKPNLNLNTRDIVGASSQAWISAKNVNPLDPQYEMSTKSGRRMIVGQVDGSKPKQLVPNRVARDTRRFLRTDDIPGAQPNSRMQDIIRR